MSRALAITLMFLKPNLRQPVFFIMVSILPLSFPLIFYMIGGPELSRHALLGAIVVFSTNVGLVSLPQLAVLFRTLRLQEMFVASPVGPGLYAISLGLSRLVFVAAPLAVVVALLLSTGAMPLLALPQILGVILCIVFTSVMLGFALAAVLPDIQIVGMVSNLLGVLLTVLPPVYYPLEMVPAQWRWLPMIAPTTHAAQLLRQAAGHAAEGSPAILHWALLLAYSGLGGFIVFRKMSWQERS